MRPDLALWPHPWLAIAWPRRPSGTAGAWRLRSRCASSSAGRPSAQAAAGNMPTLQREAKSEGPDPVARRNRTTRWISYSLRALEFQILNFELRLCRAVFKLSYATRGSRQESRTPWKAGVLASSGRTPPRNAAWTESAMGRSYGQVIGPQWTRIRLERSRPCGGRCACVLPTGLP